MAFVLSPSFTKRSSSLFSCRLAKRSLTANTCWRSSLATPTVYVSAGRKRERVDIIFNPVSGCGNSENQLQRIKSVLADRYKSVWVHETTADIGADKRAQEALDQGAEVLVASGGDGTVAAVAKALRERPHDAEKVQLGIVPRGTANAMCAALGIPADLDQALYIVNNGDARKVDIAKVNNDGSMLMQCGVGLEVGTVKLADRGFKDAFGQFAYHMAALISLRRQRVFEVTATLYGVQQERRVGDAHLGSEKMKISGMKAKAVTIANASPPLSVLAQGIGEIDCNDGLLEFVCVSPQGPGSIIKAVISLFQAALLGRKSSRVNVYGLRARAVELSCEPPQTVVIDGEDAGKTPLKIDLGDGASRTTINIIAPTPAAVRSHRKKLRTSLRSLKRLAQVVAFVVLGIFLFRNFRIRRA